MRTILGMVNGYATARNSRSPGQSSAGVSPAHSSARRRAACYLVKGPLKVARHFQWREKGY
jgi:hypothetical protein